MPKTMAATPTLVTTWCVYVDDELIHSGTDYAEALAARRKSKAERATIKRVDLDQSPGRF